MYKNAEVLIKKFKLNLKSFISISKEKKDHFFLTKMVRDIIEDYLELLKTKKSKLQKTLSNTKGLRLDQIYFSDHLDLLNTQIENFTTFLGPDQPANLPNPQENLLCFEFHLERLSEVYRNIALFLKIPMVNFFALHVQGLRPWSEDSVRVEYDQLEAMLISNRLMRVFFCEWGRNRFFHDKLRYKMNKSMRKKRPDFLSRIEITELVFGVEQSHFKDLVLVQNSEQLMIFELNAFLSGEILIKLEIDLSDDLSIIPAAFRKIRIEASITELLGAMRFSYRPKKKGKSTLSFMGVPDIVFEAKGRIGGYALRLDSGYLGFSEVLLGLVLKGFVFPDFASIGIPMTKKNRNTAFRAV